jgi:rhomboid family GlyGly-CTERM serine protease
MRALRPDFAKLTFSPRLPSSSLPWALAFAVLLVALQSLPEPAREFLWYTRDGVARLELWRIITGNLVHVGWYHLALNVGALVVGIWIFYPARSPLAWLAAQGLCSLATNLGLWWFSPDIRWCIGMSGALHGLLIIGACDWIRAGDRLGFGLLALWVGKLAWEQANGALPMSAETVGAAVVVDAHLWGAIGGALFVVLEQAVGRRRPRL